MDLIGLLIGYNPNPLEPFSSIIINSVLSRLSTHRKQLLLIGQSHHPTLDLLLADLRQARLSGLIFIPPTDPAALDRFIHTGIPLVAIADRAPGVPSVIVDNEKGGFLLAEHLHLGGHHRVIFRQDYLGHESCLRRRDIFLRAAEFHDMQVSLTLPVDSRGSISPQEEALLHSSADTRPTALVAWDDNYAYAALKYCKSHGIQVPSDLAIAGFDGILWPVETARRLTTIQASWNRVAEKAVDLLVARIQAESVPEETVLPVDLLIGDTT